MATIYCKKDECKFCACNVCAKTVVLIEIAGCASFDPKKIERGAAKDERNIIDRKSY